MATKSQTRAAEARKAKLELIREQVASGQLVIRQMTPSEQARWAERDAGRKARLTATERRRRDAALRRRRKDAERLLESRR